MSLNTARRFACLVLVVGICGTAVNVLGEEMTVPPHGEIKTVTYKDKSGSDKSVKTDDNKHIVIPGYVGGKDVVVKGFHKPSNASFKAELYQRDVTKNPIVDTQIGKIEPTITNGDGGKFFSFTLTGDTGLKSNTEYLIKIYTTTQTTDKKVYTLTVAAP
ncbi:MAG: hypothetical protein K2X82_32745 [Gemmataceae bacterium]|nr:hypothetical protein [Gemmataceae bacterium]